MQIAFDDGGFALDDMEKPSLNMNFDSDAWDDTEILQIFDAAVRSHVTKGQPSKGKKSKDQVSGVKKSRLDVVNEQSTGDYSEFAAKQQSVPSSQQYDNGPKPSNSGFVPTNAPFSHPMPPIFNQPQNQPQHAQAPEQAPPQQPSSQQFGHLAGLSSPEFDSALSDMLMAWYQSGYATGKFYTLLEQQQKTQQQQAEWWQQYNNCYQNQQEGGDGGAYQQQYSGSK